MRRATAIAALALLLAAPLALAQEPARAEPRKVYVGVYAFQVPQLDLAQNTYLVDFWAWFRWQGAEHDPTKSFEFVNLYEGWDVLRSPVYVDESGAPKPEELEGGWRYQVYRFQARFGRPFDVRAYPFDRQELVIAFEDSDDVVTDMVYVPDEGTDKVDPELHVPGWLVERISAQVVDRGYPTSWGDPRRPAGADRYSQFRYSIHLKRPVLGYLATTILPITIVMLITMVVYFIDSKYFEGRLGLAITSLISAVALQLTASGDLPRTGYLVLLDHVYNLSYGVIFVALVVSVAAVRRVDGGDAEGAKRLDRRALVATVVLYFGGLAALIGYYAAAG